MSSAWLRCRPPAARRPPKRCWELPASPCLPIAPRRPGPIFSSPNGTLLAYSYRDPEAKRNRVAVVSLSGGSPLERFDFDPAYLMRWTRDGSGLMYIAPDDNLWVEPITGGTPKQVTHFQQDLQSVSFASSPDGKQIAYARDRNNWDAVALTLR